MNQDQQLPLLLVLPEVKPDVAYRLDAIQQAQVRRLKNQSGLSKAEVVRRCLQLARLEFELHGTFAGLDAPEKVPMSRAADAGRKYGRRPKAKESALRKRIAANLRQLERDRAALATLQHSKTARVTV